MLQSEDLVPVLPNLKAQARSYTGSIEDRDDLLHDVVVRAMHRGERYEESGRLEGWLRVLMRNLARSRSCTAQAILDRRTVGADMSDTQFAVEPSQEASRLLTELCERLERMSANDRRILLAGPLGESRAQTAAAVGMNPITVATRRFRLRAMLRDEGFTTMRD